MVRSKLKRSLLMIIAFGLFYSRALRLLKFFINRFQLKKNRERGAAFPFVKKRGSRSTQILIYHRVNDDHDPFFPATPISVFEKQMEYLAAHFHICSIEDTVEMMIREAVPENVVAITFDDGYRDNYLHAFPILKRLSIPATVFLATNSIGSGRVLWHDRVFSAFRETQEAFLKWDGHTYPLATLVEKLCAQKAVLGFLRSLDDLRRFFWIDRLIEKLRVEDRKVLPGLMLTWDDVRVMHQSGTISFGSHTITHPILSRLAVDKARAEVHDSRRVIEEKLRAPVRTFAYPSGRKEDFNEVTKHLLKEAGYICAVTTIFGTNENGQDRFELRRGGPWEEYLPAFAVKLLWYRFSSQE